MAKKPTKGSWEYKAIEYNSLNSEGTCEAMERTLNRAGKDRWELVAVYRSVYLFKRLVLALAFMLTFPVVVGAQTSAPTYYERTGATTVGSWSGCRQTVVISDRGKQRHFEREEVRTTTKGDRAGTGTYGPWRELPPFTERPPRITYNFNEWPKPVDQRTVKRIMGDFVWEYFDKRKAAVMSGHFNLTADPKLDWYEFSGQTFGTKTERLPGDKR